jgi:hypothetical protein
MIMLKIDVIMAQAVMLLMMLMMTMLMMMLMMTMLLMMLMMTMLLVYHDRESGTLKWVAQLDARHSHLRVNRQ